MKVSELKSIIRNMIKEEANQLHTNVINEERVLNYKNGVTAAIRDNSVTLSHPKYGNQLFPLRRGSYRYKTPDGDEFELLSLVNKYADGKLGKGDKPYKKINKPAKSEPVNKPEPAKKFRTVNYKNGVTAKIYDYSVNLSHPKYGNKTFKKERYGTSYKVDGPGAPTLLDLVKKFAAGKL